MKLTTLPNIGKELEYKLNSVGINSVTDFRSKGVYDSFISMKQKFPNVCLVHLQVLQGAFDEIEYNNLPMEVKCELKEFYDEMFG